MILNTEHVKVEKSNYIIGLGYWNLYFLFKFILFHLDIIDFHLIVNMAFAAFLIVSINFMWLPKLKQVINVILAFLLLHHDSWLPPISRLLSSSNMLKDFSLTYLIELLGRFINFEFIAVMLITIVIFTIFKQWIRFTSITMIGFIYISLFNQTESSIGTTSPSFVQNKTSFSTDTQPNINIADKPEDIISDFYNNQSSKVTQFPASFDSESFDVVMLNICSLAWSDMKESGVNNHPLFDRFDIMFNQFSSATSYSGPAAIRLLKASCGQTSHTDLYESAPKQCYLFDNLKRLGFDTNFAMNHNGHFDNFLDVIKKSGRVNANLQSLTGVKISQHSFDGTPIYSDGDVLNKWLQERKRNNSLRAALYYNSISLHDGNKVLGQTSSKNSIRSYKPRAEVLFDDISKFLDSLEKSGRNFVVVLVPEHGASLTGDKMQIAGMREIPSPAIVNIPVGIKFIGKTIQSRTPKITVDEPSSYLSISQLLANTITKGPFVNGVLDLDNLTSNLPKTDMVAENSGTIMLLKNNKPYIKLDNDEWMVYPGH
jgi:cellulose synthase operon protein YhjU